MYTKTLIFCLLSTAWNLSDAKLYEISVREMYLTADSKTDFLDLGTLRVSRRKKTSYVVTGTVYVGHNVGNSVLVKYELYHKGELEHKFTNKLIENEKTPYCDLIRDETSMYPKIVEVSNLPPQDECPFPKGNYTINNFELKDDQLPAVLPPGDYKVNVMFYEGETKTVTLVFTANVK